MIDLKLVKPTIRDETELTAMMAEWEREGGRIVPGVLKGYRPDFQAFIRDLSDMDKGIGLKEGQVPSTTYLMKDQTGRIYGAVSLRHAVTEELKRYGGHIGYGIRPSERGKGYGTVQLALALKEAKKRGIRTVLLSCDSDNPASAAVMEKNGGVKIWEGVYEPVHRSIRRYEIRLGASSGIFPIAETDLPACVDVIRRGFATVAEEFGLTEQNCASNGAFMTIERLRGEYDGGSKMFGYFLKDRVVGFMQLKKIDEKTYEVGKLAVLPPYRHRSYGKRLLDFAGQKARELGGKKIAVGIIEENTRLKKWYMQNGFVYMGTQEFPGLPFTVGYLERETEGTE